MRSHFPYPFRDCLLLAEKEASKQARRGAVSRARARPRRCFGPTLPSLVGTAVLLCRPSVRNRVIACVRVAAGCCFDVPRRLHSRA